MFLIFFAFNTPICLTKVIYNYKYFETHPDQLIRREDYMANKFSSRNTLKI